MKLSTRDRILVSLATVGVLAAGLFLLLTGTAPKAVADADALFVTPGGSGNCSQASPCDIQTALSTATDGDIAYLGEGSYTGTGGAVVTITKSIALYGGWDGTTGTPPRRDPNAHPTVLDGEDERRVVFISGPVTVTLEGLTIARGSIRPTTANGWDGAGLYARETDLTLRAVNVYSNVADVFDVDDSRAYGGGAAIDGGNLLVEASVFRGNSAWARSRAKGGGLSIHHTTNAKVTGSLFQENDAWHASGIYFTSDERTPFTVSDCTLMDNGRARSVGRGSGGYAGAMEIGNAIAHIEGNTIGRSRAANDYGAVRVSSSELRLTGNTITGTVCGRTSALYIASVSPFTVTNNVIAENQSVYDGNHPAVEVSRGSGQFLHNTVVRNDSAYGFGIYNVANVTMTNTLLVSHTVGISVTADSTAALEGTLWGSGAWANGADWGGDGDIVTGTVNVWGDPRFVDPDGGDYHIAIDSAAKDEGVTTDVEDDIDGDPRPQDEGYDIGADEIVSQWKVYLPLTTQRYP